jgi:hypothetical protein
VGGSVFLLLSDSEVAGLAPICRGLLGESLWIDVPTRYTRKITPGTGNLMVHRGVFEEVGGFDESLREGGEDTELYRRIRAAGIDAWFTPKAIVRHMVPPYRLDAAYLLWASQRVGWQLAGRERRRWGKLRFPLVAAARLGQALGLYLPRYAWARWSHGRGEQLGARCYLARSAGYLRRALSLIAPNVFTSAEFAARLDFRREREAFLAWQRQDSTRPDSHCVSDRSPAAVGAFPKNPQGEPAP